MKSYTDIEQSKVLAKILPIESADMFFSGYTYPKERHLPTFSITSITIKDNIPCWSLAALLEELNRNCWKVSLKCCDAEWEITYDDGERYISVSADYAIDACYKMIIRLHELKML